MELRLCSNVTLTSRLTSFATNLRMSWLITNEKLTMLGGTSDKVSRFRLLLPFICPMVSGLDFNDTFSVYQLSPWKARNDSSYAPGHNIAENKTRSSKISVKFIFSGKMTARASWRCSAHCRLAHLHVSTRPTCRRQRGSIICC